MELVLFIIGFCCLIGAICVGLLEIFLTILQIGEFEIDIEIDENEIYNELTKKL